MENPSPKSCMIKKSSINKCDFEVKLTPKSPTIYDELLDQIDRIAGEVSKKWAARPNMESYRISKKLRAIVFSIKMQLIRETNKKNVSLNFPLISFAQDLKRIDVFSMYGECKLREDRFKIDHLDNKVKFLTELILKNDGNVVLKRPNINWAKDSDL
jgi:hypothetical protein